MTTAEAPLESTEVEGTRSLLASVVVLVAWTLFVWGGRVRNVLGDPTLHGTARASSLLLAGSFVVLAFVVGGLLVVDRRSGAATTGRSLRVAVMLLGGWTTAVWVVRTFGIAVLGDHPVGFVAVHVVLGAVSVAVAVWAVRSVGSRSAKNSGSA